MCHDSMIPQFHQIHLSAKIRPTTYLPFQQKERSMTNENALLGSEPPDVKDFRDADVFPISNDGNGNFLEVRTRIVRLLFVPPIFFESLILTSRCFPMCDVNGFWCIVVNWPTAPGCNKSEISGEKLRLEKIRHERLPKLIHNPENCKVTIFNR